MGTEPKQMNDGGPAFPLAVTNDTLDYHGMSLRDWFAGQALAGMLAAGDNYGSASQAAYQYADSMIERREANR
jgi:hypothetical protein